MAVAILGESWNISQKGEEIITESDTIKDKATLLKNALNSDLKEIGSPILNKIQNKNTICQVVLQIQKIRNIAAPKANENSHAAPRMLKLVLTDGDSYIQAIEVNPIPSLNSDKIPPGTKILIQSAKICSGYVLLEANNFTLLGGKVPALYEKWELAKSVQYHSRQHYSSGDGPPAWVNFGCKIQSDVRDKSFKSLENKNPESKENTKFDLQRQDAIAEATSGAVKKVFGGGAKQPVQPPPPPRTRYDFPNKDKKNKNKLSLKDGDERPPKPSERVSLFDFLEDKLPPNEPSNGNVTQLEPVKFVNDVGQRINKNRSYNTKFDNNTSRIRSEFKPQVPQHKIEENINGLSENFEKMSVNTQFASRSLRQHLNLGSQKKNNVEEGSGAVWKVGDDCIAKYWEDGKFYNASITAVTDRTCVVKFKGYGNIEEVLRSDCLPVVSKENRKNHYAGPTEFKRSARTYRRQ